jgi:hypothetical protein
VSFAFAQNWSIHVAYASRQAAYPPPIFEISVNTAVARARAPARANPELETFIPARALFVAARETVAPRATFAVPERDTVAPRALVAERAVVVPRTSLFTADRETVPDVRIDDRAELTTVCVLSPLPRTTALPPTRWGATLTGAALRGLGTWAAHTGDTPNIAVNSAEKRTKSTNERFNLILSFSHFIIFRIFESSTYSVNSCQK